MRRGPLLALLLVSAPAAFAQPALKASVSKTEVSVGEAFTVEIQATAPAGTVWSFPQDASSESVELKALPSQGAAQGYQAMVFALKDVSVPPLTASYRLPDGSEGEARTEPVPLRVTSLLPRDREEQKLADIRPPLALSVGLAFWIGLGVLTLLLVAAAVFVWRRRRAPSASEPAAVTTPPDVAARALLDRLEASRLLERGELRAYYIELTLIAKTYLERRLAAPIAEMTSAETLSTLRDQTHAPVVLAPMRSLLAAADPVKFARGSGDVVEARGHLEGVREMISALEARLQPPPQEEKVA